ncbi:MAG: DMT family transporter [Oscillospiraceae bacterium]|nr:DMT family transporter [Oscillospiraceae bacterium]
MKEYGGISKRQAEALIVLQSLVYGFGDPISKIAFEVTPVYTMMTVRYLIAFAVSFTVFHKRITRAVRTVPVKAWLIPGVCISLHYILNNVALALTDATSVAFLRSLSIVITPAFAFLIYRTSYKWQHIVLQILVLPGMYLLCVKGGLSGAGSGEAVALVAAFMSAGALVFSKRYLDMVDPVSMTALMAGCSAGIALIGSLIFEGGIRLETTTPQAWAIILYLAIACTFLGYLMQNLALTRISDRSVALIQSLCPVMTAVFSFFLLGETLSTAGMAGAGIIVASVALASIIHP